MNERPRGFPRRFPVRDDMERSWRYRALAGVCRVGLRVIYRGGQLTLQGVEHIPADGPLLVAGNHLSNLDPVILGAFFPRTLFVMAKRELFFHPVASWVFGGANAFPVHRGAGDRAALRTALELLNRGARLLLFVEGTRSKTGSMTRAQAGVGFLLARSKVPVLPVAVWGSETALVKGRLLPRRTRIEVRIGPVFEVDLSTRDNQAIADAVAARVAALLPPQYRGVY